MTAAKVWEYRHLVGNAASAYKYADKVGTAQRLENGNTIVLFGADIDPVTLATKNPQTFTLVEADSTPQAQALAVLDFQMPGANPAYRALPVESLFGEVNGKAHP
jgi:ABC-type Zn2+ transport system substrate-binding protein/surface adhesin